MVEAMTFWDEPIPTEEEKGIELVSPERDADGHLYGASPVRYRMCFEFDPPLMSHKEGEFGEPKEMHRAEFFSADSRLFYFLHATLSRVANVTKAEAVILDDESRICWRDKNPDEDGNTDIKVFPY